MNSPLTVHDGNTALACQIPTSWHRSARPKCSEPALSWGGGQPWRYPLHTNTHFSASGQEVQDPDQLVSKLCSQASLANHLFGIWDTISHKYHVIKSDKVPMLAHKG